MSSGLGIWLVRQEASGLGMRLQKQLGGCLHEGWRESSSSCLDKCVSASDGEVFEQSQTSAGIADVDCWNDRRGGSRAAQRARPDAPLHSNLIAASETPAHQGLVQGCCQAGTTSWTPAPLGPGCQAGRVAHCSGGQKGRFAQVYRLHSRWVLVMATGIAVRYLDGLIVDKHSDPAVVVLDEAALHAISLLAGHEGGANELAYEVAAAVGADPVVTTATQVLKPLTVGIGCCAGTTAAAIEEAVLQALGQRTLSEVRCVATVDLKQDEPGLQQFCRQHELPLRVFPRQDVAARSWVTTPSSLVRKQIGADGVCEPCALMTSPRSCLIVPKTTGGGVAVAIAEDTVRFSDEE